MTPQTAYKIASEFYAYRTSRKRLSVKYDVSEYKVKKAIKELRERSQQKPEKYAVIKVPEKWVKGLSHLLDTRGIPHEVPEHFELIEYYESKL